MKYLLTDPETHIDFGFGVLASDFYQTADFLWNSNENKLTKGTLPNLYLYRHSIELYLKSLIIIIHKKMELNYKGGKVPFDSKEAYVKYIEGNNEVKWKKLTNSHFISTLYNYFEELIIEHEDDLRRKASQEMSKIINTHNKKIINHIKEYDDKSTFFRYVDLSDRKNEEKESEKKYNKRIALEDFEPDLEKPTKALLVVDDNADEVLEVHQSTKEIPLKDLGQDLRNLADYLSGIHAMFRTCLCDGF